MTMIYRVRAHPLEGEDFIYEGFENKSDADKFWEELMANDGLFDSLPYEHTVISYEEYYRGVWVKVSVKTARRTPRKVRSDE